MIFAYKGKFDIVYANSLDYCSIHAQIHMPILES